MDSLTKQRYLSGNIPGYDSNEIEIEPEYVYMMIPSDWVCIYHKLLAYLADFGEAAIKDCAASCQGSNLYVIQCWNIFQSAVACYNLGLIDKANVLIKYIKAQLELSYSHSDKQVYCKDVDVPISEDGHLKATVSCINDEIKFTVDEETGHLYQEYLEGKYPDKTFKIENNHLIEE